MDFFSIGYGGLFAASFLSATLLPMSSEGILLLMLSQNFDPFICLFIATIGNSLGGYTNYFIGSLGNLNWLKRFGMTQEKLFSLEKRTKKYGHWLAFFSWVPFIGDPLSVALGYFKVPIWRFLVLMILGKFLRYAVFVYWFIE